MQKRQKSLILAQLCVTKILDYYLAAGVLLSSCIVVSSPAQDSYTGYQGKKCCCTAMSRFSLYCPALFPSQGCQSYRKCWTLQPRRTGRWQLSTSWQQQKRATACCSRSCRRRRRDWWWWTVNPSGWTSSLARLYQHGSPGRCLNAEWGGLFLSELFFFPFWCDLCHSSSWIWCVCVAGISPLCCLGKRKAIEVLGAPCPLLFWFMFWAL